MLRKTTVALPDGSTAGPVLTVSAVGASEGTVALSVMGNGGDGTGKRLALL